MSIRKRASKKAKNGYVYEVYFPYINATINMYKNDHIKMYKINST